MNDVFDSTFCVYRFPVYFQTLISKLTEQHQNFANSDRYTNEDAEINNSNRSLAKVLHSSALDGRCSKEGVLQAEHRTGSVRRPKTGVLPTVLRNQPNIAC